MFVLRWKTPHRRLSAQALAPGAKNMGAKTHAGGKHMANETNEGSLQPTTGERLDQLIGLLEEMTTGGEMTLDCDEAADIYAWLLWARDGRGR